MCNKQRIKTREDLKFLNLTEAGSFSWSQNRGCKSTWCEWRPRRRWLRGLCSSLQQLSQCHLREISIRMVYHLIRCYLRAILTRIIWSVVTFVSQCHTRVIWSGWSDKDSLIRCYYHGSDDKIVFLTDVTGLWQGVFFVVILTLIIALHFKF